MNVVWDDLVYLPSISSSFWSILFDRNFKLSTFRTIVLFEFPAAFKHGLCYIGFSRVVDRVWSFVPFLKFELVSFSKVSCDLELSNCIITFRCDLPVSDGPMFKVHFVLSTILLIHSFDYHYSLCFNSYLQAIFLLSCLFATTLCCSHLQLLYFKI